MPLNFDAFGASTFLWGEPFQKVLPKLSRCLSACRVEKFRDVTPTSYKIKGANTLYFKPNFNCLNASWRLHT